MIHWIMKSNSVSPRRPYFVSESLNPAQLDHPNNNVLCLPLPKYGARTEADNPEIPKGLTQAERDADHLVEAFAGFTIVNAARFRKTSVITSIRHPDLLSRWDKWGHVVVFPVNKFFKTFVLDEKVLSERMKPGGSSTKNSSMSPAALTPNTPIDPGTPQASGDSSTSENPAQGQRRSLAKDRFPAPYR